MRTLAIALVLPFLLVSPAHAAPQVRTAVTLVAAEEGGIVALEARRYEESAHGPVLAAGYVRLEVKSEATHGRWKVVPGSKKLAYKGRARWFFSTPTKPGYLRAVSIGGGGYRQSYSKPVHFPL